MSRIEARWEDNGTTIECRPFNSLQATYDAMEEVGEDWHCDVEDVSNLPDNYEELDWHLVTFSPNMWGDDVRIALDETRHVGYSIHDCICSSMPWTGSLVEWLHKAALDPEEGW